MRNLLPFDIRPDGPVGGLSLSAEPTGGRLTFLALWVLCAWFFAICDLIACRDMTAWQWGQEVMVVGGFLERRLLFV